MGLTSLNRETICSIYSNPDLMTVKCLLSIISLALSAMVSPNSKLIVIVEGFRI